MSLGDLVFILCFFGVIVAASRIAWRLAHRRTADAKRSAGRLAGFLALYFAVLLTVSLTTPGKHVPIGESQCFDEWCIAVVGVEKPETIGSVRPKGAFWIVNARVSNRGGGRRQRETGAFADLVDRDGHRFDPSPEGQAALAGEGTAGSPLTAFVDPGGSFPSRIVFDVPPSARDIAFVKSSGWFPVAFIIGDPGSLLHRRTVVDLGPAR
jgi:hypothetical protein